MSRHSLTITYALPAAAEVTDGYWLRLEQEDVVEDVATVGDAATVIDSLFQLDACNPLPEGVSKTDLGQSNPLQSLYPTSEEVTTALMTAAAKIDLAICDQQSDGSVTVRIRVIRSHPAEPYRLRISGGTEMEAIQVMTEISRTVTVEDATSHTLDYPVIAGFSGRWMGNVISQADQIQAINRTGNTLHWQASTTGAISCSYLTQYDLVTVKVAGVDGKQGAAMVRCFYHGLVEELEPQLPKPADDDASLCAPGNFNIELPEDRVTCFKTIVVSKRCGCSKKEVGWYTYEQMVPCPEWGPVRCPNTATDCMHQLGTEAVTEYVDCTGDGDSSLASPATYQELCCHASPPPHLPDCSLEKRVWKGGAPIVNGVDYYRQIYGRTVRIVPVAPDGGICGEWTIRQMISNANCCDLVDPPVWNDQVSAQVLSDNSQGTIMWSHSLGPYKIRVAGTGFWLDRLRSVKTIYTAVPWAEVYTSTACGTCDVIVEDACGNQVTGWIRSTTGQWAMVVENWAPERVQGDNIFLYGSDPRWYAHETIEGKYKVRKESTVVMTSTDGFISPVQPLYSNQYFRPGCSNIISRYVGPTQPSIGHDPGNGDIPGLNTVGPTSYETNPNTNINYYMQYCSAWMFYPGVRWNVWEWTC